MVEDRAEKRRHRPWSGYWFVNVGENKSRNWDDNVKYGFIGAGHGPKASGALRRAVPPFLSFRPDVLEWFHYGYTG